jgi:hypothetical protein
LDWMKSFSRGRPLTASRIMLVRAVALGRVEIGDAPVVVSMAYEPGETLLPQGALDAAALAAAAESQAAELEARISQGHLVRGRGGGGP